MPAPDATGLVRAPIIDGRLDDPVWGRAAIATDFWVSEQGRSPSDRTEVLVFADEKNLYVGFRAYDSNPKAITAIQTRRDAGLGFDDQVTVELDTFQNARDISRFSISALGTQDDSFAGGRAQKIGWKGDWRGAAVRTDFGWSAEIAIPFEMLNYASESDRFNVNFIRYQYRTGERSYWSDVTPQFKPELMGVLTGLMLPRIEAARWTFMPYVLGGANTPDRDGEIQDSLVIAGADIRYRPLQDVTGVLSLNPDFSTIEAQFADINFSYTEKAVLDPRPFFQEGAGYFDAGSKNLYFYSNRVPNFDAGLRGFGRMGKTQFGAFATTAPDSRRDYAARLLQELDATHSVALSAYGASGNQLDNLVAVGQVTGRETNGFNYSANVANSQTQGDLGSGNQLAGNLGWSHDYWYAGVGADSYDKTFFPANGLLPGDLPGTRGASGYGGYYRVYGGTSIYSARGDVSYAARDTDKGESQRRYFFGGGYLEFQNQIRTGLYYSGGRYRPVTSTVGVFSPVVNNDGYWTATLDFSTRSPWLGYGVAYSDGNLGGGKYRYLPAYVWVRPRPQLFLSLTSELLESFGYFDQTILVAKWDVTPQDAIGGRVVLLDGQQYYRLTYGRQVRAGMDVFALIDKVPDQATQFTIKLLFTFP
jgi:hypothetical protein